MKATEYFDLYEKLIESGYQDEIDWSFDLKPCTNSADFFSHYVFVVCNSGMKAQIARVIYQMIMQAIADRRDISKVFGHKLKVKAIKEVLGNQSKYFGLYLKAENKIEFLETLPHIGPITKYHLAKDLGVETIKPDRHLVRIANNHDTDPFELCERLAKETGHRLLTVDLVLWRSANLGLI